MKKVQLLKKIKFPLFCLFLCVIVAIINVSALEKESENVVFKRCPINDEYLEWEKLSDEEKAKTVVPPICAVEVDENRRGETGYTLLGEESPALPSSYDGRKSGYVPVMKDQSSTGSCWAFSTSSALEFYSKKSLNLSYEYSPRHIVYSSVREFLNGEINEFGYNMAPSDGGNFFMSSNYLTNGLGPVLESDMPFEDNEDVIEISEIQGKQSQIDVNDVILGFSSVSGQKCSGTQIEKIKQYVYDYGSVVISTYMTEININYYNSITSAFYYNGLLSSNHAVLIVGWDDNYSRDNFSIVNKPSADGAWIVQNSYGTSFGDNGYYYISYEDVHVCDIYMAIKNGEKEFEDNAYIYDKLGFNISYRVSDGTTDDKSGYAMNVFTKEESKREILKEVTFATSGIGEYSIYYVEGNGSSKSISEMMLIGNGTIDHTGYITHKLDENLIIESDVSDFSIVVHYLMDSYTYPVPLSSSDYDFYSSITHDSNKSFVSPDGSNWTDTLTMSDNEGEILIPSIKAFTNDFIFENITSDVYTIDQKTATIYVQPNTTTEVFFSNISISNSEDVDVSSYSGNVYTGLKVDEYTVVVYGDVTGDGFAKMNDVMRISQYIVDKIGLEDSYYMKAADVTLDSFIKMNDVMKISNYIVEGGTL